MEEYYAENFNEFWTNNRVVIFSLDYKIFSGILSLDEFLQNKSQETVWQIIHDWMYVDKKNRLTYFKQFFKKYLQFENLTEEFVKNNIFQSVIFKLLPLEFQKDLKIFAKSIYHHEQNIETTTCDNFNLPSSVSEVILCQQVKKNINQLLLSIDRIDGLVEFYDYHYSSWHSSPLSFELVTKETYFELQLVNESMLFAFGGRDDKFNASKQVWSYNLNDLVPQWTSKTAMNQGRDLFSSVVLNNFIYALGGRFKNDNYKLDSLKSCERYDIQQNEWSIVAEMNIARHNASAAVLNGCIYIAGGRNEKNLIIQSMEKYDPESNSWSEVASMITARRGFSLTAFSGSLWAIGGENEKKQSLDFVEFYNPVNNTWQKEISLNENRFWHAAIDFDGELYVAGGWKNTNNAFVLVQTIEKYQPGKSWCINSSFQKNYSFVKLISISNIYLEIVTSDIKQKRFKNVVEDEKEKQTNAIGFSTLLNSFSALDICFNNTKEFLFSIDIRNDSTIYYDSQNNNWHSSSLLLLELPNNEKLYQLEMLENESSVIYAFCRVEEFDVFIFNTSIYSFNFSDASAEWKPIPVMNKFRHGFTSIVFNNYIYILGGKGKIFASCFEICSHCEKFDNEQNKWFTIAELNSARCDASAAVLNGFIYIAGGENDMLCADQSVEKYDPQTDVWSHVAPMNIARTEFTLTSFAGRLWAIGGRGADYHTLSSVESYDPVTDTWQEENNLNESRFGHSSICFKNKLYVVGGWKKYFQKKNIFNPIGSVKTVETYKYNERWVKINIIKKQHLYHKLFIGSETINKLFKKFAKKSETKEKTDNISSFIDLKSQEMKQRLICINNFYFSAQLYDYSQKSWHWSTFFKQFDKKISHKLDSHIIDNNIYVINSLKRKGWSINFSEPVLEWKKMTLMNTQRKDFSSVTFNGDIYVLGGWDFCIKHDKSYDIYKSVERYDRLQNKWSVVAPMSDARSNASAAVLNGYIYIAGGKNDNGMILRSVEKYDPQSDTWSYVAPMSEIRSFFALTPFSGRLWAIGGDGTDYHPLSRCESYDPKTDTWRKEATLNVNRSDLAAIEFYGELYVVGGEKPEAGVTVEKYTPGKGWQRDSKLVHENNYPLLLVLSSENEIFFTD